MSNMSICISRMLRLGIPRIGGKTRQNCISNTICVECYLKIKKKKKENDCNKIK